MFDTPEMIIRGPSQNSCWGTKWEEVGGCRWSLGYNVGVQVETIAFGMQGRRLLSGYR